MIRGPLYMPVAYSDIEDIAIAITRFGEFFHAAMAYRDSNNNLQLMDLSIAGMKNKPFPDKNNWAWAVPMIPPSLRRVAATVCERVAESRPKLYYGFKYLPAEFIASDGSLPLHPDTTGFTCATFVLSLLKNAQIDILKHDTWQPRDGDAEWQTQVYSMLVDQQKRHKIPQSVMDANHSDMPCLRYRPEDVVAGCLSPSPPIDFAYATQHAPDVCLSVLSFLEVASRRPSPNDPA